MKRRELLQWALRGTAVSLLPFSFPASVRAFTVRTPPRPVASGADITVWLDNRFVGVAKAMTVSITREVAALYSFHDPNPKSFVKGKRGIAGTLVLGAFDPGLLRGRGLYADQLPELELRVHQHGKLLYRIVGAVLVNEGWSYTARDLEVEEGSERAFTYVARDLEDRVAGKPVGSVVEVGPNFYLYPEETMRLAA